LAGGGGIILAITSFIYASHTVIAAAIRGITYTIGDQRAAYIINLLTHALLTSRFIYWHAEQ
jgi:hypothetical protein